MLAVTTLAYGRNDSGKPGLLVIAHGSPAKAWNQPGLAQEQKVLDLFGQDNPFGRVKVVFVEFAEPNVADGLEELQKAGCSRIVAVPMLITPASHSHWDIPALIGLYSDPRIEKTLREEGAKLVRVNVPVTLTPTLSDSDVMERVMLKRVRALSNDPNREAVVLLADEGNVAGGLEKLRYEEWSSDLPLNLGNYGRAAGAATDMQNVLLTEFKFERPGR